MKMQIDPKWIRYVFIAGVIATIAGAIDPMEGSIVIATGSILLAISTCVYFYHNRSICHLVCIIIRRL
jgi:hypothetical protein